MATCQKAADEECNGADAASLAEDRTEHLMRSVCLVRCIGAAALHSP